jgi:ATP-binding cassette, subfamily B, multidrug efflux pump
MITGAEETATRVRDWELITRLVAMLGPYWPGVLAALASALATMAAQIFNPLVIAVAIDVYFLHREPEIPIRRWLPVNPLQGIELLSAIYLCILLLNLLFEVAQGALMQWIGQKAMADLRRRVLIHLQRLHISFYDTTPVGRIVTRATSDIEALSDLFSDGMVSILANAVMTTFFLCVMFRLNYQLTLVLAAILPFFVALTAFFRGFITESQQKGRVLIARINAFIAEHANGISVVQVFNREQVSLAEFDSINRQHMAASKQWVAANAWFLPSIEFFGTLSQAGLLLAGGFLLHRGRLTVGTLVAFLQYGTRFLRPIQEISERYAVLQSSVVSAQKVFDILDTPESTIPSGVANPSSLPARIEFDRIWFAYRPQNWILTDVSFRIEPGEMLAIVGHTGAGKTTITNLLLRFYQAQQGEIRVGGADIRSIDTSQLRRRFGVVLQDPCLWEGTVLDNIRFGADEIAEAKVLNAATEVGLDAALSHLPLGLSTQIHERGENLSSGQKQLIAFARALAQDPQYLILDEATSNIDVQTEFHIRTALRRLLKGRTSIVIAHRLSTILTADQILVMHKGKAAEIGTHESLLAKRGLYWRLFQLQFRQQDINELPGLPENAPI